MLLRVHRSPEGFVMSAELEIESFCLDREHSDTRRNLERKISKYVRGDARYFIRNIQRVEDNGLPAYDLYSVVLYTNS
jgi:hypothetical protein